MFPEELPKRLIRMFTFVNDVVLDPFLGSGTTSKVAMLLGRNSIGYELNISYLSLIQEKIGILDNSLFVNQDIQIIDRENKEIDISETEYCPTIQNALPVLEENRYVANGEEMFRVVSILDEKTVELNNGLKVELLGMCDLDQKVSDYLNSCVKGRQVFLRSDPKFEMKNGRVQAYLFLKNKIFVNKEIIRMGMAKIPAYDFKYKNAFMKLTSGANDA